MRTAKVTNPSEVAAPVGSLQHGQWAREDAERVGKRQAQATAAVIIARTSAVTGRQLGGSVASCERFQRLLLYRARRGLTPR
jgi:hypothetical protein